jgi:predicted nucleic acid-binding protein
MARCIVLDTFPLSSVARRRPSESTENSLLDTCQEWVKECVAAGHTVLVPAICYYEVLRELERLGANVQITRLRAFCRAESGRFWSITDAHIDAAARLWAQARNAGTPTASTASLDCDVLLAAQALDAATYFTDCVIATTNPAHLTQFTRAELWTNITP